jgi:hypothetical protein
VEDDSSNIYLDGDTITLNKGDDIEFYLTPDPGWRVGLGTNAYVSDINQDTTLTVNFRQNNGTYDIWVPNGLWPGSISPAGTPIGSGAYAVITVAGGGSQTFTFTPATGYKFAFAELGLDFTNTSPYTFTNIDNDYVMHPIFTEDDGTNMISISSYGVGTITPSEPGYFVTVNDGDSQTFTFTPGAGYHVGDVLADGLSVGAVSEYTFENVTEAHKIEVHFEPN